MHGYMNVMLFIYFRCLQTSRRDYKNCASWYVLSLVIC